MSALWKTRIDYLGDDAHTKSIRGYMETLGDARTFLSAAREVTLRKPSRSKPAARRRQRVVRRRTPDR
jgi:hypothetical protein